MLPIKYWGQRCLYQECYQRMIALRTELTWFMFGLASSWDMCFLIAQAPPNSHTYSNLYHMWLAKEQTARGRNAFPHEVVRKIFFCLLYLLLQGERQLLFCQLPPVLFEGNNISIDSHDHFQSVTMNIPYLRTLVLVVPDEADLKPSLSRLRQDCVSPKVRVVKHSEFIPLSRLPLFNPRVVETFVHHIPNLTDQFILCDDTTFFRNFLNFESFRDKNHVNFWRIPLLRTAHMLNLPCNNIRFSGQLRLQVTPATRAEFMEYDCHDDPRCRRDYRPTISWAYGQIAFKGGISFCSSRQPSQHVNTQIHSRYSKEIEIARNNRFERVDDLCTS